MDKDFYDDTPDTLRFLKKLYQAIVDLPSKINATLEEKFGKAEQLKKAEIVANFPDIQKVEVTNQAQVKFPEIQKVSITNLPEQKLPEVQKVEIQNPAKPPIIKIERQEVKFPATQRVITDLPKGKGSKPSVKGANPTEYLVVRVTTGDKFVDTFGGGVSTGGGGGGEVIFDREEFTWTVVSGTSVPSRVVKFRQGYKVIEDYAYDVNARVTTKTRHVTTA